MTWRGRQNAVTLLANPAGHLARLECPYARHRSRRHGYKSRPPNLAPNQAQQHATVNESLRRPDVLVQLMALSAGLAAEPANTSDGDAYTFQPGRAV